MKTVVLHVALKTPYIEYIGTLALKIEANLFQLSKSFFYVYEEILKNQLYQCTEKNYPFSIDNYVVNNILNDVNKLLKNYTGC